LARRFFLFHPWKTGGDEELEVERREPLENVICAGPSSVNVAGDGSVEGIAVCGLDVLGLLATIELSFEGTVSGETAGGTLTLGAVGVAGGGTSSWTGTLVGDTLTLQVDTLGTFGANTVSFTGTIAVQADG
jgi:hypothetical protein